MDSGESLDLDAEADLSMDLDLQDDPDLRAASLVLDAEDETPAESREAEFDMSLESGPREKHSGLSR